MIVGRNAALFVMAPGGAVGGFSEHLGTAFLRTVLARAGIATCQYLPQGNPGLAGFSSFLREIRPRVVGFTAYESNLNTSRALVRVARQALSGVVLLVGGPNATFTPAETLEILEADVCVRGAAEGTVTCLLKAILGAESASTRLPDLLGGIPNLVLRVDGGARATWTGDLSSFPRASFPTLDDVPSPFIDGVVSTPDVGYVTARGCNQHCTYCSFAALSKRRVAFHSVERVLDDLQAIEALAAVTPLRKGVIDIWDDTFSLVPARVRRICEGILERGIRLPLRCVTRADTVTPDLLQLMRRAGFDSISFGLESAVPRVLRAIGKVQAPSDDSDPGFEKEKEFLERIRSAVRDARHCGLKVRVSVIGGLPGESATDFRTTLDFVSALDVETYAHNVLCVLPGTPLYESRHAFGLEAYREVRTGRWRTAHAYDVEAVPPL
jgi:anaerobic magnesium-protoporphyrin IX monomethyl ester cyclase